MYLSNSLFISICEHFSKGFEWLINTFALQGAHLKELKTNWLGEGLAIIRSYHRAVLQINLVSDNNSTQGFASILLTDTIIPLLQKMECVLVSDIVYKHNKVGLSEEFKSDLLKDILSSNVNAVKLDPLVGIFLIEGDVLDVVLTALGHHVLMIEVLVNGLVNKAGFANCWFSSDDDTGS